VVLSLRLSRRRFPKIFRGGFGLSSRIKFTGEIALEDGIIWEAATKLVGE